MKRISIAELKHKVLVCSAADVVIADGEIVIERKAVYSAWAKIEAKAPSTYVPQGVTVAEPREKTTHVISIRYRSDIQISSSAWLYEERLKSAPRLFKITRLIEDCDFFTFYCRLTERGDLITPIVGAAQMGIVTDAGI